MEQARELGLARSIGVSNFSTGERMQHDVPVISKSTHRGRIEENAQIFDFVLSAGDMAALDAIGADSGGRALEHKWW
jgi:diketogulonate reductase-like aldo/keto reductase